MLNPGAAAATILEMAEVMETVDTTLETAEDTETADTTLEITVETADTTLEIMADMVATTLETAVDTGTADTTLETAVDTETVALGLATATAEDLGQIMSAPGLTTTENEVLKSYKSLITPRISRIHIYTYFCFHFFFNVYLLPD